MQMLASQIAGQGAAPFHVFLAAYAILGPLHYLTEISWLHDRGYFTRRQTARSWWLVLVALAVAAPAYGYIANDLLQHPCLQPSRSA
jgi:hypothetical protein